MGRAITYKLIPTPHFAKQFKKLDKFTQKQIKNYLENMMISPREKGKALIGNWSGQWRYRIGSYRVIVNIQDTELIILALEVGHRKEIYKWYLFNWIKSKYNLLTNKF